LIFICYINKLESKFPASGSLAPLGDGVLLKLEGKMPQILLQKEMPNIR